MKNYLAILTATVALGVSSSFAVNPFSDVTPQDWAYQAVSQLATQGIVTGYPDDRFIGQHDITRYEMAQMVAKSLTHKNRLTAEQQAIINRLTKEFSSELANLGIRTDVLEHKIGNFSFNGDIRFTYEHNPTEHRFFYNSGNNVGSLKKSSMFTYRTRLQFTEVVNDNTKTVLRISSGDKEFGSNKAVDASLDRLYIQHNFGKYVRAIVGRHDGFIGDGLTYDGAIEGATLVVGKDTLNASFTYGYAPDMAIKMAWGDFFDEDFRFYEREHIWAGKLFKPSSKDNAQLAIFQVNGKIGNRLRLGAFYTKVNGINMGEATKNTDLYVRFSDDMWAYASLSFFGAHGSINLGPKLIIDGEFATFREKVEFPNVWTLGLTYGNYNIRKQGTWSLRAQNTHLRGIGPVFAPTFWTPANQSYVVWLLQGKYVIANNVGLTGYAMINPKDFFGNRISNSYHLELKYHF